MKRIWIVSELYYPEQNATGRIMTAIAEAMTEFYEVGAICAQPTYDARGTKAPSQETRNGVKITRIWGTTLDKNVLPFRLVNAVTTSLSMYLTALRLFCRGDAVLVVTNPPTMPPLVLKACVKRGASCALLVHDVYPDVLLRTGMAGPDSRTVASLARSGRKLLAGVERVIAIGRDMRRLLESKAVPLWHEIDFIPNWADLDTVRPLARSETAMLEELGLADKFVIQYAGNMGRTHGLETALEVAEGSDVQFVFIGSGAKKAWLKEESATRRMANVAVLDFYPLERLNESLNACDLALISFLPGMSGISVPSRMYNVMAAGKPILAVTDADSELAEVVREEGIGWVIEPANADALRAAIEEARANPGLCAEMGVRARAAAEAKYAQQAIMNRYHQLFDELLATAK